MVTWSSHDNFLQKTVFEQDMKLIMISLPLFILILGLAEGFPSFQFNACPPRLDIFPCSCGHRYIRCEALRDNSIEAIESLLPKFNQMSSIDLQLIGYDLGTVSPNLFSGLDIAQLSLGSCSIDGFEEPAFRGLEDSLEELDITGSLTETGLKSLPLKLDHLKKLSILNIASHPRPHGQDRSLQVGDDWFGKGPSSITILKLTHNSIESLGDKAFSGLKNLKELNLRNNKIEVVQRSMFPESAESLTSIDLYDNIIESLPEDLFSNMPSLERVRVSGNLIDKLDQSTWKPVWEQLEYLNIGDSVYCDSHINWTFDVKSPKELIGRCSIYSDDTSMRGKTLKELIEKERQ